MCYHIVLQIPAKFRTEGGVRDLYAFRVPLVNRRGISVVHREIFLLSGWMKFLADWRQLGKIWIVFVISSFHGMLAKVDPNKFKMRSSIYFMTCVVGSKANLGITARCKNWKSSLIRIFICEQVLLTATRQPIFCGQLEPPYSTGAPARPCPPYIGAGPYCTISST